MFDNISFWFVVFENLSFWFLDVVIFQNQKHILTISKIYFKFGFCHFVGAFFLRKNFAVSQPDVGWFSKKKLILQYQYPVMTMVAMEPLEHFFQFVGVIILVRKKGGKCQKISRMSLNFDISLRFLSTSEPFWWPRWKNSWSFIFLG